MNRGVFVWSHKMHHLPYLHNLLFPLPKKHVCALCAKLRYHCNVNFCQLKISWISRIYYFYYYYFISQCNARDSIIIPASAKRYCDCGRDVCTGKKFDSISICTKCTKEQISKSLLMIKDTICHNMHLFFAMNTLLWKLQISILFFRRWRIMGNFYLE